MDRGKHGCKQFELRHKGDWIGALTISLYLAESMRGTLQPEAMHTLVKLLYVRLIGVLNYKLQNLVQINHLSL